MTENRAMARARQFVEGRARVRGQVTGWTLAAYVGLGATVGLVTVGIVIQLATAAQGSPPGAASVSGGDNVNEPEGVDPELPAQEEEEAPLPAAPTLLAISINRDWDVLAPPPTPNVASSLRPTLRQVGELLGDWQIYVAGVRLTGPGLLEIADGAPDEPLLRRVREELRRPFDLLDLLLFLDDVLAAGDRGLRGKLVWITSGRARGAGITIHPDDVFKKNKPRLYAGKKSELNIDKPKRPANLPPAKDGDLLGPEWTARFRNPSAPGAMLAALNRENVSGTYVTRLKSIRRQVRKQGGSFYFYTTVRNRHRGYLMWGAFMLSRLTTAASLRAGIKKLERLNKEWGLHAPIRWRHPDGWKANIEAAREMSDAYDVVYATENGAKNSNHYGGQAVDMAGFALPRSFTLEAPDGAKRTFDLSDPEQTRDISLTPEIVRWIEEHFQMRKLELDYPHWNDVAPRQRAEQRLRR